MISNAMAFVPAEFMFQAHEENYPPSTSPNVLPSSAPQEFQGVSPILMRRSISFSGAERYEQVLGDDDMSDDGSQFGEKKKIRLNLEQVKTLEKNFELGNKLEPERKMELARALGLQPRQIAIWFQNRRARWKTKQLEKDYNTLKRQFEALKADNNALQAQNKKLHEELLALKSKESTGNGPSNLNKETKDCWSNGSDENSFDVNLSTTRTPATEQRNNHIFLSGIEPTSVSSRLQNSSRSDLRQSQKMGQMVPDEGFCNMFNGIHDQPAGFWP
ncbi:hypothetical protein F0562_004428 [Nyssa sinensis]|uniref:Homeobox-leucine zipper protein n=1 Tax=Nyssa sinensis TaxID=561372 RepID=A0A5J5BYK4_9ASTE|nr:hypothetical protein F0562_004428 [Nyssa sinensis]